MRQLHPTPKTAGARRRVPGRILLALATLALLVGCGGADDPDDAITGRGAVAGSPGPVAIEASVVGSTTDGMSPEHPSVDAGAGTGAAARPGDAATAPVTAPLPPVASAPSPATPPTALAPPVPVPSAQVLSAGILANFRANLASMSARMDQALRQIHLNDAGKPLDGSLTFVNTTVSFAPLPRLSDRLTIPLAQGRSGRVLGYAYEYPQGLRGRGLVYGADVLTWMSRGDPQIQHQPLFRQAWNWALQPGAAGVGGVRYVNQGHDATTIERYITGQLNRTPVAVSCDLAAAVMAGDCTRADVFVLGGTIQDNPAVHQRLVANVQSMLRLGKTVMYFSPSTWDNAEPGTNALLHGLIGAGLADYPGNYYSCPESCEAVTSTTFAELRDRFNWAADWIALVDMLAGTIAVPEISENARPIQLIEWSHQVLGRMPDPVGSAAARQGWQATLEPLVAWADVWRPQVVYGASIDKTVDRLAFLRAYASDSWIQNNRSSTSLPAQGAGRYTHARAVTELKPSTVFEDIAVTIPQSHGITLIGRAAVPGQRVEIEVADPGSSSALSVQSSYMRTWERPLKVDPESPREIRYNSPRRPGSWPVALVPKQRRHFITPFGGPLLLTYADARPGEVVKLRIRGAAPYAHLDFTQPTPVSDADIDEMSARVKKDSLGWMTFKFVGGEVQQRVDLSTDLWARTGMAAYLRYALPEDVFRVNHWSNGYNNVPRRPTVSALCKRFEWDCSSELHRPPGVQHFVGWIAACGSLCSGQPVDAYGGFDAGWGTSHELGHNTVQRVHSVSFTEPDFDTGVRVTKGCFAECDNNILAVVTGLAAWARDGTNIGTARVGTRVLYDEVLLPARAEAARLRLDPERARQLVGTRLWSQAWDAARWGMHFQLAALYAKHRHPDSPKVHREMMFDYLAMLTMGDRLVMHDWSPAKAGRYAMGRYASNTIDSNDLVYVLSSKIIGRDLRRIFAMHGVPLGSTALGSVADLGLPVEPLSFYAFPDYAPTEGVWLDLEAAVWPAYPFDS